MKHTKCSIRPYFNPAKDVHQIRFWLDYILLNSCLAKRFEFPANNIKIFLAFIWFLIKKTFHKKFPFCQKRTSDLQHILENLVFNCTKIINHIKILIFQKIKHFKNIFKILRKFYVRKPLIDCWYKHGSLICKFK